MVSASAVTCDLFTKSDPTSILTRAEIGAVGPQEEQPCTSGSYDLFGGKPLVGGKIVEDDHIALCQRCLPRPFVFR